MLPLIGHRYRNLLNLLAVLWAVGFAACDSGSLHHGAPQEIFPADPCFDGLFVSRSGETEILFEVIHTAVIDETPEPWNTVNIVNGLVTLSAWEISAENTEPWEDLSFNGEVRAIGEAEGIWTVNYPADSEYSDKRIYNENVTLRDDPDSGCPDLLDVDVAYRIGTELVGSQYTAHRVPSCVRRRPSCEL